MGVSARYIVDDVEAAIAFYTQHLGFRVDLSRD
jgi:catechol 2,3-dioxygenase-like lactoylglutathione lyase family enzyme